MNKIIGIVGPTASGKTALAIHIANRFDGEIINCDSMQIYKRLSIGTAKPTVAEQNAAVHHLLSICEPSESFSAAQYCPLAHEKIDEISSRGKIPVIVGGTGLYFDSVINRTVFTEESTPPEVRERFYEIANEKGAQYLYSLLCERDASAAEKIHPNNIKRVIRALEICENNTTKTERDIQGRQNTPYPAIIIGLRYENRELLYEKIDRRVDIMFELGLLDEVKYLYENGFLPEGSTARAAIGYKEIIEYFEGNISLDEAKEKIKGSTHKYAKRQMTWFKRNENINWLSVDKYASVEEIYKDAERIISEKI